MKQALSLLALLLMVGIGASAQKKLGDYIEIDGVPAIIFQLDDTGEHGLAISMPQTSRSFGLASYPKRMGKILNQMQTEGKISGEQLSRLQTYFQINADKKAEKEKSTKIDKKEYKALKQEFFARQSNDGKNNAEQVKLLCQEKGISMEQYFPYHYMAQTLGEGWFLPGDKELTQFATFYLGGLGKEYGLGVAKYMKLPKEKSDNELVQEALLWMTYQSAALVSSNYQKELTHRFLCGVMAKMNTKNWLDLEDYYGKRDIMLCYVHEF